jgi:hypothetical protein
VTCQCLIHGWTLFHALCDARKRLWHKAQAVHHCCSTQHDYHARYPLHKFTKATSNRQIPHHLTRMPAACGLSSRCMTTGGRIKLKAHTMLSTMTDHASGWLNDDKHRGTRVAEDIAGLNAQQLDAKKPRRAVAFTCTVNSWTDNQARHTCIQCSSTC